VKERGRLRERLLRNKRKNKKVKDSRRGDIGLTILENVAERKRVHSGE
jgi:hypothetical protein